MQTSPFYLPSWLAPVHLEGMRRGIEKESLRMNPKGLLAKTPHPKALGSKLTHPHITTDYSEGLLELITSPHTSIQAALFELTELHSLVFAALEDGELLWPLSMPCMLGSSDADILLADYGASNIGRLKTLYRMGLGLRYGRRMQTIAGLHYNLSFGDALFDAIKAASGDARDLQDIKNDAYFGLIRNFKRLSVMVLYLLGASPSVCACFLKGRAHHLTHLGNNPDSGTLHLPAATSLRMGRLGYQNSAQDDLDIHYNSLGEYAKNLRAAVSLPHAPFTDLGVDDEHGNPVQINDHILQIENEFYANIRPKQVAESGETPTHALESRGVAYVELRAVDLDPFSSIGISTESAHFLEVLALYCLLKDSPELLADEEVVLSQNQDAVVNSGRDSALTIQVGGTPVNFHAWVAHTLADMQPVADMLDAANATYKFSASLATMHVRAKNPDATPSAQVLAHTKALGSTWRLGESLAKDYASIYENFRLTQAKREHYEQMAARSTAEQAALEAKADIPFYEYVQQFR